MIKLLRERLGQIGRTHHNVCVLDQKVTALSESLLQQLAALRGELDSTRALAAQVLIEDRRRKGVLPALAEAEFKVFSQFGDDGIIQYLVDTLCPSPTRFVEFGVSDYLESNTRFLLTHNNWNGLVMEGDRSQVDRIRKMELSWRHDLTAVHAFVDRDNINDLLRQHGFDGPLGLLHIDIDGNDYWVWNAIDACDPTIVIMEYNSVFGSERPITVPYDPAFVRSKAHYSRLFYGASLPALCHLANQKEYAFVGSNSAGNNAYFVKRTCLGPLKELTAVEGYVESRFSESCDERGGLTLVRGDARRALIADLPVVDVSTGEELKLGTGAYA